VFAGSLDLTVEGMQAMQGHRTKDFDQKFRTEINRLRAEIETVPEEFTALLKQAVDTAEEQHERMRKTSLWIDDMVADIGLYTQHAVFTVDACRRELRAIDPIGKVGI
jgi:hypothetical protein